MKQLKSIGMLTLRDFDQDDLVQEETSQSNSSSKYCFVHNTDII